MVIELLFELGSVLYAASNDMSNAMVCIFVIFFFFFCYQKIIPYIYMPYQKAFQIRDQATKYQTSIFPDAANAIKSYWFVVFHNKAIKRYKYQQRITNTG